MPDSINAMIPLAVNQPVIQTPGQVAQGQDMQLKVQSDRLALQEQMREQHVRNAMTGIFSDPKSLDPATGLPTQNAIARASAIDPSTGMKLQQQVQAANAARVELGLKTAQTDIQKTENFQKKANMAGDAALDSVKAYEDSIRGGDTPEIATQKAQEVFTGKRDELTHSGLFTPDDIDKIPTHFDIARMRASVAHLASFREMEKQDNTALSPIAKADADLKAGRITQAEHDALVRKETHVAEGTEGKPMTDVGKLNADLKAKAITQEQYDEQAGNKSATAADRQQAADIARWRAENPGMAQGAPLAGEKSFKDWQAAQGKGGAKPNGIAGGTDAKTAVKLTSKPKPEDLQDGKTYSINGTTYKWNSSTKKLDPL